jgi:hypothetical protein
MGTQTQYAWAAGFFDGEGCVSLHSQGRYTVARIVLVQKDIRPLLKFKQVFDLTETLGIVTRENRRHDYYRLTLSGQTAADVLTKMLPYLSLKREVAEVALDLQVSVVRYSPKERSAGLPDSEMQYRKSLVDKAKYLNSGRWAAAETKPSGRESACDSPNCSDDKAAELAEMSSRSVN